MTPEQEDSQSRGIATAILSFSRSLDALREFVSVVGPFLNERHTAYLKEKRQELIPMRLAVSAFASEAEMNLTPEREAELRAQFGATVNIVPAENGKGGTIEIEGEAGTRFEDALKGLRSASEHQTLLYKSCLISLISSAEWFLSQALRGFFEAHPGASGIKDKTLTLEDLSKIGSIDEAQSYLISLRVDEIMWGGYEEWLKFLRNALKLPLKFLEADEAKLTEVFQRRHTMVHNDGVVHPSYIAKVTKSLRENVSAGKRLSVGPQYLQDAIDVIERTFILLGAELWQRSEPRNENRTTVLFDLTLEALKQDRNSLGEAISLSIVNEKKLAESTQLSARLNYWQSLKWQGRFEEIRSEVENADFSAKDDIYQLARLVLLDDYQNALEILRALFKSQKLTLSDFEEWPIFKMFRLEGKAIEITNELRSVQRKTIEMPDTSGEIASDSQALDENVLGVAKKLAIN